MKDYRPYINRLLQGIKTAIPFTVSMAFPESIKQGNVISYYEINNSSTNIATVDDVAFQIDIWCIGSLENLLTLMQQVDDVMTGTGFKRQFSSPDSMLHDPSGYLRKSLRYGRKIDVLTNRLID